MPARSAATEGPAGDDDHVVSVLWAIRHWIAPLVPGEIETVSVIREGLDVTML